MVRYFYAWTPLLIVGAVVLLSLPWLGVIALMLVALVPLVALWSLQPMRKDRACRDLEDLDRRHETVSSVRARVFHIARR